METNEVFSVASRFGYSSQPDDVEAVLVAGVISWPSSGAYSLRNVVYFESRSDAQAVADRLGAHRPDALVAVSWHYADASYILLHESRVLRAGEEA